MLKRFVLIVSAMLMILSGIVAAQEVTVVGYGNDRNDAIKDAARLAVEQVAGSFIDSRMLVENLVVQLDEVYRNSQGFIKTIEILDEGISDFQTYRVQARIDVDTAPDGELVDRLTMIIQLNDPRITVAATDATLQRDSLVEYYFVESLIDAGFHHVTLAQETENTSDADYLISCKFSQSSETAQIPVYDSGETKKKETAFSNARANIRVAVIKCDTGETVGTFETNGRAMEIGEEKAKITATRNAAKSAADMIVSAFKKISANFTQNLSFKIIAADNSALESIIASLRTIGRIDNIWIREVSNGTAILSIDSSQRPHEIVAELKNRTSFGVAVENMTNSSCTLRIN